MNLLTDVSGPGLSRISVGAAGIISPVLQYYMNFIPRSGSRDMDSFLPAAAVGCQIEVGPTCAMASVKMTNTAQLALRGDGAHAISFGQVIPAVRDTGRDELDKYKEISHGSLAVSLPEC
ncbi:hypothetical protein CKO18_17780 [Rhodoferax fermentans]|nr:hypothetical protein [Rhodoferax fermentans]